MKNYVIIVAHCDSGIIYDLIIENDIWKSAEKAVQQCVDLCQMTKFEAIEIVQQLNLQEHLVVANKIQISDGPKYTITIWQK